MADISGRGGQSALRFARLRMEKRHNYVRKVAEVATTLFIINDKPNVAGIILAGSADFKTELSQSDMFDPVGFATFETTHESVLLYSALFLFLIQKWPHAGRMFYILAVQVHTDYQFYCVPEHDSWNGSFIILEACIHQHFKALFFQVSYVELYRETGSEFPVDAGFLRESPWLLPCSGTQ